MIMMMEDLVLAEFEDLLQEGGNHHIQLHGPGSGAIEPPEDDFDETALKPMDASTLSAHELDQEMRRRGKAPKGFRADDEKTLQIEFNREHEEYVERLRRERMENREKVKKQAAMQRRRLLLEKQLREEQEETAKDHRLEFWLTLIRQNATAPSARLEVSSVTARCVAKALWDNTSLTALDVSGCHLDDTSGTYLARMLKHNSSLVKLEMGSNKFGPRTCAALAQSLSVNKTLRHLDVQSNQLTRAGEDLEGMHALCDMLRKNTTLTYLNLWRCELGVQAGQELVRALDVNDKLLFLEAGLNEMKLDAQIKLTAKLERNLAKFHRDAEDAHAAEERRMKEDDERRMIAERIRKDQEYRQWLEDEKRKRIIRRCEEKRDTHAEMRAARIAEEKAEQEKYEEEKKAREEAEAKKKKKAAAAKKK